jgi:hypothetical protein
LLCWFSFHKVWFWEEKTREKRNQGKWKLECWHSKGIGSLETPCLRIDLYKVTFSILVSLHCFIIMIYC